MDDDQEAKRILFDDRLESYRSFFDHTWAREIVAAAEGHRILSRMILNLCTTLKGTGRTAEIPSLAVSWTESYVKGFKLHSLEDSESLRLLNHVAARIDHVVVLSADQKAEVKIALQKIADEAAEMCRGVTFEFPKQELWDRMAKILPNDPQIHVKNEFRLGMWACLRVCYLGTFFAYEDFLVQCVATKLGRSVRTTPKDKFSQACEATIGTSLEDRCWKDPRIVAAKAVRHALAHAGGRVTNEVKSTRAHHDIQLDNDEVHILPEDVGNLFELVKPRITDLVQWAAPLPEFR